MGFEPGNKLGGRKPGSINKTTASIKEAYQALLENNLDNMSKWLARIAEKDPKGAAELMLKLSEYILPKLARTEMTGSEGKDLFSNVKFEFSTAKENKEKEDAEE